MNWWFWTPLLLLNVRAGHDYEPKFKAREVTKSFLLYHHEGANDYCDLTCNNGTHTLCQTPTRTADVCDRFELVRIDEDLRNQLVHGHNGLRDRFARLQNATSMRMLQWDQELARMAERWARTCEKYAVDPCTQLKRDFSKPYTLVNQNSQFLNIRYFPDHFVASRLRSWYKEKKETTIRIKKTRYTVEVYLDHLSNYSQIIWAKTERVGCAIFRLKEGIRLICNYWPFTGIDRPAYLQGPACSDCPRRYPMCSKAFLSLCTNRAESAFSGYALINTFVMVGLAILLRNFEV